jgi:hypothetical protein
MTEQMKPWSYRGHKIAYSVAKAWIEDWYGVDLDTEQSQAVAQYCHNGPDPFRERSKLLTRAQRDALAMMARFVLSLKPVRLVTNGAEGESR